MFFISTLILLFVLKTRFPSNRPISDIFPSNRLISDIFPSNRPMSDIFPSNRPLQITNPNSMTLGWEQMGKCTTAAAASRNITRLI